MYIFELRIYFDCKVKSHAVLYITLHYITYEIYAVCVCVQTKKNRQNVENHIST